MLIDELTRMANQIADFFSPYPEDEAIAGVRDHLEKFWTPSMRKDILEANTTQFAALKPLAQQAIDRMRDGGHGNAQP